MRIAIVGGGATGTSVLASLVRHHRGPGRISVTVFEMDERPGPGRAFAPGSRTATLNQPAGGITLRPDEPEHFLDWLARRAGPAAGHPAGYTADPDAFLPRETFGRYLESAFRAALSRGPDRGVHAGLVTDQVMSLDRGGGRFGVRTATGTRHTFDAVFLCTGSSAPTDVYGLSGHANFTADPYPLRPMSQRIPSDASVAVLGTGLSAADAVLELAIRGHQGPLRMYSRSGLLPDVRNHGTKSQLALDWPRAVQEAITRHGRLRLRDIYDLVVREMAAHSLPASLLHQEFDRNEHVHDRLARHLGAAQRGDAWHALRNEIVMAVLEGEGVWDHVDTVTRRALRRWHAVFLSACAPLPLPSAGTLDSLIARRQLSVEAGIHDVTPRRDGPGFVIRTRTSQQTADHVVNTIRPHTVPTPDRIAAAVASLLANRLAAADPLGGLRIAPETNELIAPSGDVTRHLYAFGQLAFGECYFASSSLHMITRRVERTVRLLLAGLPAAQHAGRRRAYVQSV